MKPKTLLLIDGHGLAFRAFFALPQMNAPDGTPTNAVVGFANMYLKIVQGLDTENVAVCFDSPSPSFRKAIYPEYKEGRQPTPEAFKPQLPLLKEFLGLLGCPVLEVEGVEADDLLASIAVKFRNQGWEIFILTADKDFLQLLRPGITILKPLKGISEFETLDVSAFTQKFGFQPEHFTTWLSLTGDSVDNISGVPGIGEKTATSLVSRFPTLESLLENLERIPAKTAERIRSNEERLKMNLDLVSLKEDVPFDVGELLKRAVNSTLLEEWTGRLGLKQLARRLNLGQFEKPEGQIPASANQGTLSLGETTSSAEFVELEKVLAAPPFGLAFLVVDFPARKSSISAACLSGSNGTCAFFDSSLPLDAETLDRVLNSGSLTVWGLKELCGATGWKPTNFDSLFDLRIANYLLHPEKPAQSFSSPEASLSIKAFNLLKATPFFEEELQKLELQRLAKLIDMPIVPVLCDLEKHGLGVDRTAISLLAEKLGKRIAEIASSITEKTGTRINLNSPQQVASLLFDRMGLDVRKKKKTGPSTDASVLESLAADKAKGEIPRLLLEHREASKLLSGFVEAFQRLTEPTTGAIHSSFDSLSTATGRLSSKDPNVQNLPQFGDWAGEFRKCLIPRDPNRSFLSADYSQIELRVLAHLCGDEKLRQAFESGRDIHNETASWVFNVHSTFVTPDLRRAAKAINFGLLYGMSSHGLAQRLGVGRSEAQEMIERYFSALPSVRDYLEQNVSEALRRGYTRSFFGRIRPLSEVSTANGRGADAIRRIVLNTPIQSTAADIAKLAMIRYSKSSIGTDGKHPLVLQVHDSLICECPRGELEEVSLFLRETMENVVRLSVPLRVEIKSGDSLASV